MNKFAQIYLQNKVLYITLQILGIRSSLNKCKNYSKDQIGHNLTEHEKETAVILWATVWRGVQYILPLDGIEDDR